VEPLVPRDVGPNAGLALPADDAQLEVVFVDDGNTSG
jgi:hypothetical protein